MTPQKDISYPITKGRFIIRTSNNNIVAFFAHTSHSSMNIHKHWRISDRGYLIQWYKQEFDNPKLSNVPTHVNKTWGITMAMDHLQILCNGIKVLYFRYDNGYSRKCTEITNHEITSVTLMTEDTATEYF